VVIGYIEFPPVSFRDADTGELKGHAIAMAREIARQAEWEVEFQEQTWDTFQVALTSGRVDFSVAPTFVTVPRARRVAFSDPVFYAGNSAIAPRADVSLDALDDLRQAGLRIAVTQGEAGAEYARVNLPDAELLTFTGAQTQAFDAVRSGNADVALGDAYAVAEYARRYAAEVRDVFEGRPYNLTPVAWATRYEDLDLLTFLNASLLVLATQGFVQQAEADVGANWLRPMERWQVGPTSPSAAP
jgi:ABC-type amino acid transport substrate-binding protein